MSHKKAIMFTGIVAILWSLAGLNIKMIKWAPLAINGTNCLLMFIILTPYILRQTHVSVDKYTIGAAIFYTGLGYCFTVSTKLTTAANAVILQYTAPFYIIILSGLFLHEKVYKIDFINISFVFCGILLFFVDEVGGGSFIGNCIAVFNGITFAGIAMCLRLQKNQGSVMYFYLGNLFSGLIGLPFIIQAGIPDLKSIFFLALMSLEVCLSFYLYGKASASLTALEIVLLPIIEPVMSPVWVYLFVGEKPGLFSIIGACIVILSIIFNVLYKLKQEPNKQEANRI